MSEHQPRLLAAAAVVVALLAGVGLTGCAAATESQPPESALSAVASSNPNDDVAPDDTDYSVDAGNDMPEYEYEDEPAPPPTVVGILCNLNQDYFRGLRTVEDGTAIADDNLRTNLVGLSDLLGETDSLRLHYPEAVPSIEIAEAVYLKWEFAIVSIDNQEESESRTAMAEAEDLLEELPAQDDVTCVP